MQRPSMFKGAGNLATTTHGPARGQRLVATPGVLAALDGQRTRAAIDAATPRTLATPAASLLQIVKPSQIVTAGSTTARATVNWSNQGVVLAMYGSAFDPTGAISPTDAIGYIEAKIEIQGASYLTSNGETADFVPYASLFPSGAGYLAIAWPVASGDKWNVTWANRHATADLQVRLTFSFALQAR